MILSGLQYISFGFAFHYCDSVTLLCYNYEQTSTQVSMWFTGPQEHGLARLQNYMVEKIDGEASDISWVLRIQSQQ